MVEFINKCTMLDFIYKCTMVDFINKCTMVDFINKCTIHGTFIYEVHHGTYKDLLVKSIVTSLKIRRLRTMVIEVYRIINKESPSYLHDLVKI
jgi:hypothetical protein